MFCMPFSLFPFRKPSAPGLPLERSSVSLRRGKKGVSWRRKTREDEAELVALQKKHYEFTLLHKCISDVLQVLHQSNMSLYETLLAGLKRPQRAPPKASGERGSPEEKKTQGICCKEAAFQKESLVKG